MRKASRILLVLLLLVLALTLVVACSGNDDEPTTTPAPLDGGGDDTTPPDEPDPVDNEPAGDQFPEFAHRGEGFINSLGMVQVRRHDNPFTEIPMDLGGRTIRIGSEWWRYFTLRENIEETPQFPMVSARALESIEIDYNVRFEIYDMGSIAYHSNELVERIAMYRSAGDVFMDWIDYATNLNPGTAVFDFFYPASRIGPIAQQGRDAWMLWTYFPGALSRNGEEYLVNSHGSPMGSVRDLLLFNQDILDRFGIDCLYTTVRNNEWTHDKFSEITNTIFEQSGGEILAITKRWAWECIFERFMASNNALPFENVNGYFRTNIGTDNALRALTTVTELIGRGMVDFARWDFPVFRDGEAVFMMIDGWQIGADGGDAMVHGVNVGLVPFPMGPDATRYSSMYNGVRGFAFVDNGGNMDEMGAVFVAFASRIFDWWPDLMEEDYRFGTLEIGLLDSGFTMDDVEMAEIVLSNLQMNHRNMPSTLAPWYTAMRTMRYGDATPREAVDAALPAMQAIMDELNNTN